MSMKFRRYVVVFVLAVTTAGLGGCSKKPTDTAPKPRVEASTAAHRAVDIA